MENDIHQEHLDPQGTAGGDRTINRRAFVRRTVEAAGGAVLATFGLGTTDARTQANAHSPMYSRKQATSQGQKHHYFVPRQILFLTRHETGFTRQHIAERVRAHRILADPQLAGATIAPERITTFSDGAMAFSLVCADVPLMVDERALFNHLDDLNQRIDNLTSSNELNIEYATPNWLLYGAPEGDGSGGPGGKPVAVSTDALGHLSASGKPFWQFAMSPDLRFRETLPDRGTGVDVFILDTAPDQADLERAYTRWKDTNPLIATLLGSGSPLDITYAGYTHLLQKIDFYLPNANYLMSDHGLFVAGIIHTLAPKARLHLVEVLNPYGVGSFESIAHGLAIVAQEAQHRSKVLINASLCFDVPQPDSTWLKLLSEEDPFWVGYTSAQIDRTVKPLQLLCDHLRGLQVGMFAAAGNEGRNGYHPPARYPAAFASVTGVGALMHDNRTPTEYSNVADAPQGDGIITFGGDSVAEITDTTHGMIGVYTGPLPDGIPNETGWARWAGTSFATPIITGAVAALMCEDKSVDEAMNILRTVSTTPTVIGQVFPVTQGG